LLFFQELIVYNMQIEEVLSYRERAEAYLIEKLLPFWMDRMKDQRNGGFITHFDERGKDTGDDRKSLISQTRSIYTLASAHRGGYGDGRCIEMARFGIDFLINKMWDEEFGGFYWMTDRKGNVSNNNKVLYGLSFAIYCLSEYTIASNDPIGLEYAESTFDLIQKHCYEPEYGGYLEMFDRQWRLAGPGSGGGDRKTLDVHMHLMEAFTTLYECSRNEDHKNKLREIIDLLNHKIIHPEYKTGIPQFTMDWKKASQIKFDIIWGWDRFTDGTQKENPEDNTCFGHNAEFAWLLIHALKVLKTDITGYKDTLIKIFEHTLDNGIDWEYGGVYVEGPHQGGVYDKEKEFWQQAEVLIGMLDAFLLTGDIKYWKAFCNVFDFVFAKVIHHEIGEWWPLLTREGKPIWSHMGHDWKINYHSVRSIIQSINRLREIEDQLLISRS
jgi:mannobiose 2-epimerase